MTRVFQTVLPTIAALALPLAAAPATAAPLDRDQALFQTVEGEWQGPGEVVAGKYKGTKFVCTFKGATATGKIGLSLDGGCRVGVFTQKMSASFERRGKNGYRGTFMDGAEGKGLDITAGNVDGRKVVLSLNRNQLHGAMQAKLPDDNTMHVTVSVRVDQRLVPVIGMRLKRVDADPIGSVAKN